MRHPAVFTSRATNQCTGNITLPVIGDVKVQGLTLEKLSRCIFMFTSYLVQL